MYNGQEAAIERGKQVNNLARKAMILERQNRVLRSALRELAACVSDEAWRAVVAVLDAAQESEAQQ